MATFVILIGGGSSAWAYTVSDLTNAGWTKLTTLEAIGTPANNFYVFVDAGAGTYAMSHSTTTRPAAYRALSNPVTTPEQVWVLETTGTANVYSLKCLSDGYYLNAGNNGWDGTMSYGKGMNADFTFTVSEGKYSLSAGTFGDGNYVGPWDGGTSVTGDQDLACNKPTGSNPGFYIYSISRTSFLASYLKNASSSSPVNLNGLIDHAKIIDKTATGWTTEYSDNSGYKAVNFSNNLLECYNYTTISIKQTVNLIQYGLFELGVKGFYRPGDKGTTADTKNVQLYADDNTVDLALINSITSYTVNPGTGVWQCIDSKYYVPDNMAAAEYAIFTDGKYANTLSNINLTSSNSIELGIKKDAGIGNDWTIFNDFSLKCTGLQLQAIAADALPIGSDMEANTWYTVFIPTAGKYYITSTSAATITYTQDGTKIAGESTTGTAVSFAAGEQKSIALSAGMLYIKSSAKQTVTIDMRFYLTTTVDGVTKWLNKNESGVTYVYDQGLPFTLEWSGGYNQMKFSSGNYLNDVGSNWATKIEGSHNNDWVLTPVEGGYKIKLKQNTNCELFVNNTPTGFVEISHNVVASEHNVWQFVQPETALASAIFEGENHTIGFEDGEYAPYNNVAAVSALNTANAAVTTDEKISAYAALGAASWTANVGEVNAIYWDYSTLGTTDKSKAYGWYDPELSGNAEGSMYSTRVFNHINGKNNDGDNANPGLGAVENNVALFTKKSTNYGKVEGYTLPLKANRTYKLTFKYAGWTEPSETSINITDANGENQLNISGTFTVSGDAVNGNSNASVWADYEGYFTVNADADYIINFVRENMGNNIQRQLVMGNILLKSTDALEFADGSVPTYAPGTYPSVKITRTLTAGRWATAVYPFAVSGVDNIAVLNSFNAETGSIGFKSADQSVANQPFLMRSASDKSEISLSDIAVSATTETPTVTKNEASLIGAYNSTKITNAQNNYVLSNNGIYDVGANGATINPYRAYIQIADVGGASRSLVFLVDDEETTAIEGLNRERTMPVGNIYNLNGQLVRKNADNLNGLQKGIYIVGGKRITVK